MARVYDGYYRFIIAPELNTFPGEVRKPDRTCHHYGEKFLPFDAYTPLPIQLQVWGPLTLEPLTIEIAPKAYGARRISVQFQIWGRGNRGVQKERTPIPPSEKSLPHCQIFKKFPVQPDVVKAAGYPPGKVNHTL